MLVLHTSIGQPKRAHVLLHIAQKTGRMSMALTRWFQMGWVGLWVLHAFGPDRLGVSGQVWLQVQGQKDDSSAGLFPALGF
jgi:hypothetical protein